MDLFPLTIFPEGGLAGSIITTVWVGVFIMCFFNLRYGWVLSGLVVPGYLVPLLIVKPLAAAVIGVEAVVTYLIVWLFSEKLAPGRFPSLFGRDRFMGLILASIAVRLSFDGYLLPEFSQWLESNFDQRLDWENNLQSFGLVIISLMANQFWKPGLARGIFMSGVTIGLTFVVVRYGLMEITNFRVSSVVYLYEGLSSSIFAGPKAYIILTLTAMIASHYNVRYGWDFSGILIPALIALQWYQPTKILTSFGEAIIIYFVARLILKMPFMANVTLEGGRKLLLFFNISFAWKMLLGWMIVWYQFEVKTTDFFGFGYLLSTLIAIKAHDKDIFPRLARSTLQVSLIGALLGNFAGFALAASTARIAVNDDDARLARLEGSDRLRLDGLVINAVGDAYVRKMQNKAQPLSARSEQSLSELVELLQEEVPDAVTDFDQSVDGWRILRSASGRIAIIRDDEKGAELLLFDPNASRKEAIILPDPTLRPGLAIAALELRRNQDARWLVFGAPSPSATVGGKSVTDIFQEATNTSHIVLTAAAPGAPTQLEISDAGASLADIGAFRRILPDLRVSLADNRPAMQGNQAILKLSEAALSRISGLLPERGNSGTTPTCKLLRPAQSSTAWSELAQLAFARFEIAAPMIMRVREGEKPILARAAANLAGMNISQCVFGTRKHWNLTSRSRPEGSIFLAEGQAPKRAVMSFANDRGVLPARIGAAVHSKWDSSALFIANRSDSFLRDPHTVFDVVWQEWVRNQNSLEEPMIFQLRARPLEAVGYRGAVDVLVAKDRIGPEHASFPELMSALRSANLRPEVVTNTRVHAGMEARPGMSARYLDSMGDRRHTLGWLMFPGMAENAE